MRKILLSIASLLIFAGSINATNIGYSKDDIDKLNTFRLGRHTDCRGYTGGKEITHKGKMDTRQAIHYHWRRGVSVHRLHS